MIDVSKKILVIDDDPPTLKGIEMVLKDAGYITKVSLDGNETIKLVGSFNPDLVLLDAMLAGLDGRTIAQELKANDETRAIPIIMISANHALEKDAHAYGIDTFISKPFSSAHLLQLIGKY